MFAKPSQTRKLVVHTFNTFNKFGSLWVQVNSDNETAYIMPEYLNRQDPSGTPLELEPWRRAIRDIKTRFDAMMIIYGGHNRMSWALGELHEANMPQTRG